MPFIILKYQKCGKNNCKCNRGYPHGPYFWLCKYIKAEGRQKRKIKWKYLGKDVDSVELVLKEMDQDQDITHSKDELASKVQDFYRTAEKRLQDPNRKSTSKKIYRFDP